jgi:hypothetical protein
MAQAETAQISARRLCLLGATPVPPSEKPLKKQSKQGIKEERQATNKVQQPQTDEKKLSTPATQSDAL